jgi:hypothetical protein
MINIMAVSPKGAVFHSARECTGETKSGIFISKLLIEAVKDIGPDNIVQVLSSRLNICVCACVRRAFAQLCSNALHCHMSHTPSCFRL